MNYEQFAILSSYPVLSVFLAILSSYPVIITALLKQNSRGGPPSSLLQCKNYMINTRTVGSSTDFNPSLEFCGYTGYPGIKIRLNRNAFRYASSIIAQLLNQEIQNFQIPEYTQSLREVNGYARLTNIMITNYQCPEHVALFPISHNQIGLKIQNFALSTSGQLDGQIIVLLPFTLCGAVCIDARQISMTVQLTIKRNPYNNAPYIRMTKCSLTIGYLNIEISNGGLIGVIINDIFRTAIISRANETIPEQFCDMVPGILDERVNPQLANIPREISIRQMILYAASLINRRKKLPDYCSSEICKRYQSTSPSLTNKKLKSKAILTAGVPNKQKAINTNKPLMNLKHLSNDKLLKIVAVKEEIDQKSSISTKTDQKSTIAPARISNRFPQKTEMTRNNRSWRRMRRNTRLANIKNNNQWEQCANCDNEGNEILSYYSDFVMNRVQTCASDLALSTYLLGSSTTNYDLTFDLVGEFSPNARGGAPFGAPVLQYPVLDGGKMLDLLISDYTFNTLLYHLHRKGIFSFRIGPEIPVVGDLLNLTCTSDEIDFDLSVTQNGNAKDLKTETTSDSLHARNKRLITTGTLLNLGICFGNIAPAIREKYPGKKVYIIIGTSRAPSIQFHAANNDTIVTDLMLDGFIFLDGTAIQVGHLRIANEFAIKIQIIGNRIIGKAQVQRMEFVDVDETFGIPQEAFMDLSDLARGIISEAINRKLANGFPIEMLQLGLPINLHNIRLQIIKHALFISTDFAIPSLASNPRYTGCFYYN